MLMRLRQNSQCSKIYEALKVASAAGTAAAWVEMPALVEASGSYNIHSRIDELRHVHGVAIENETDLTVKPHISRYRLSPSLPSGERDGVSGQNQN